MSVAQRTLADLLLKETCQSLASMISDSTKDITKSQVVQEARDGYNTCKKSLSALRMIKLKYPQALPDSISVIQSPASLPPSSSSTPANGEELKTEVAVTCVRPVADAAAAAAKDLEALQKSLDAIHFIQCNSNARISSTLDTAYTAALASCVPLSRAHMEAPQLIQTAAVRSNTLLPTAAALPSKLIFKQPSAVTRSAECILWPQFFVLSPQSILTFFNRFVRQLRQEVTPIKFLF